MSRTIYYNGNFITLEKDMPEANYLISEDGRIKEIGTGELPFGMNFEKAVDLKGRTVIPGFIDSHLHMLTGALTKLQIDLNDLKFRDVKQLIEYIRDSAEGGKGWIRAFGFSEDNLDKAEIPIKEDIDRIISERPVIITRVCGHLSVINSRAMELLDREKITSVEGGEFKRNADGDYSGVITEAAQQYVLDNIPPPDEDAIFNKLEEEQEYLLRNGICSIHDAGTDQLPPHEYVKLYEKFNNSGKLKLRTYLMMRPDDESSFDEFAEEVKRLKRKYPPEKSRLFFGAVKLFADGSLGGRTAAVRKGYINEEENKGILLAPRLDKYVGRINEAGLKTAVHAIGDRACEYCLELLQKREKNKMPSARHRIEHAELLDADIIKRIKESGIFIAAQPGFIYEFGNTYRKVIGKDAEKIQPLRTLLKEGIPVGFGTDYPVIEANPMKGIAAAAYRRVKNSCKPLNETEMLDVKTAVAAYTLGSAEGADTTYIQGSLKKGKFADFVVLDKDIREFFGESSLYRENCGESSSKFAEQERLEKIEVLATVIGGELLYLKKGV